MYLTDRVDGNRTPEFSIDVYSDIWRTCGVARALSLLPS